MTTTNDREYERVQFCKLLNLSENATWEEIYYQVKMIIGTIK